MLHIVCNSWFQVHLTECHCFNTYYSTQEIGGRACDTPHPLSYHASLVHTLESGVSGFCCCSVLKSRLTLCNPMDDSRSGSSVFHNLPEFTQIHVY